MRESAANGDFFPRCRPHSSSGVEKIGSGALGRLAADDRPG
jgi:hypothetical protein